VSIDHGQESFRREPIADYDEPVARYLTHAIAEGATVGTATRLTMTGQTRVGMWLPFRATERCGARSFEWRARVGWGNTRILDVLDSYASGRGRTSGRLLGRMKMFEQADDNTARSAAGRVGVAPGRKEFGYIPCGCELHAERRFGKLVVPSRVTVGWWFGTPRYAPVFKAETTISRLRAEIRAGRAQRGFRETDP
jgi:hypothetical protein